MYPLLAVIMFSAEPSQTALVDLARLCGCDHTVIPAAGTPERRPALSKLGESAAKRSPARAARLGQLLTDSSDRKAVLTGVFTEWSGSDPDSAAAASGALRDLPERRDIARIIAGSWAATDPDRTGNWIARMPDGEPREAALTALLQTWAKRNAEAAARWVSLLPEGRVEPLRIVSMGGSVSVAGLQYSRAAALQALGLFWAAHNRAAALAWAQALSDPEVRKLTIGLIEKYRS